MVLALENFLVKRVRKFLVLNEINKSKVITQTGISSQDVFVVPIGVDVGRHHPDIDADDIRQRYSFNGEVNILFVGRICAEKGLEYLIKAADILVNQHGNSGLRLLLVGPVEQFDTGDSLKSKYMSKITGLIESSGLHDIVRMTGTVPVDDLRKIYAASDMVVLPSIVDLDPQVLLEAMAMGKPVISTRVGAIPWRITDGKSGFVIDPASEQQLAEKIKYLVENPVERKRMGDNGRKIVCEEYSAEKMAERTLLVYQSIN
jgi:glycosyltransferase involved in cell wall biosynthesis